MTRRGARRRPRRGGLVNRWRLLGVAVLAAALAAYGWLVSADDFRLADDGIVVSGLRYTDDELVRLTMAPWLADRPNLFVLPVADVAAALRRLPAVVDSEVSAILPDRLVVAVVERVPVFTWRTAAADFLVDVNGVLLRVTTAGDPLAAGLPVFDDGRRLATRPAVGGQMEPVDLEAVLKLAAVDPELAGSSAATLVLSANDDDGFALTAAPLGWQAVFGHYTPTLRPPELIDRQVQCLRALLDEGESRLVRIYLAPADDRCGTFVGEPSPAPTTDDDE